ncbi:monofunctional biosynthetic peptidoglycan transglycosylase [Primorskyibacter flagellatus]|uniref:Biosynthetic peptidoglycan transglycosylase n=1 Tax=Primorskyibacter flagellatus TaxID=1387277 RepID=A0A1W2AGN0_9RHOB|nr:monofunctional biosynthetic peptidoglycan transglycosylase [Primorskyibacter flagellatus]SMC59836.1 monofunctional biosynthetic peptidoglycan transglycosylase [Primorskyibacter flagellatus]
MAGKSSRKARKTATRGKTRPQPLRWVVRRLLWAVVAMVGLAVLAVVGYAALNPPTTPYMVSEGRRLGQSVDRQWVSADRMAPVMLRAAVAAEDANFCTHWGFDMKAIRAALENGGRRGASTISQQVVKNVYLWHGRSWLRKALEALLTPAVEAVWSKRRILEVYLNVAEFDEGVFGVEAASRHYFGVGADALSATQAARLAAVLPAPRDRSAAKPTAAVSRRANSIRDGAATIARDGRAACFEAD